MYLLGLIVCQVLCPPLCYLHALSQSSQWFWEADTIILILWMMQREYSITQNYKVIECTTRICNCTWMTLNQGFFPYLRWPSIKNT